MLEFFWYNGHYVLATVILGIGAFAVAKGGRAERLGGLVFVGLVLTSLAVDLLPDRHRTAYALVVEFAAATAFLLLAMRYSNFWLAGAMVGEGLIFAINAYRLGLDQTEWSVQIINLTILAQNLLTFFVTSMILFGTIASVRARIVRRRGSDSLPSTESSLGTLHNGAA